MVAAAVLSSSLLIPEGVTLVDSSYNQVLDLDTEMRSGEGK